MRRAAARSELLRIWSRGLVLDTGNEETYCSVSLLGTGFLMMVDNESPAQRYRRLAEECLEVAYTFPDGERRTVLVQMAQVWQRLADERASSAALPLFSRVEGQAAPVQQQQQIQRDDDKNE